MIPKNGHGTHVIFLTQGQWNDSTNQKVKSEMRQGIMGTNKGQYSSRILGAYWLFAGKSFLENLIQKLNVENDNFNDYIDKSGQNQRSPNLFSNEVAPG